MFLHAAESDVVCKTLVFLLNHWMWAFGMQGALLGIFVINTMTIICLHEFIGRYINLTPIKYTVPVIILT